MNEAAMAKERGLVQENLGKLGELLAKLEAVWKDTAGRISPVVQTFPMGESPKMENAPRQAHSEIAEDIERKCTQVGKLIDYIAATKDRIEL